MTPTNPNDGILSAISPDNTRQRPGLPCPPAPLKRVNTPVANFMNTEPSSYSFSNRSFSMGIFSRTRDIIAANVTDLLDKSEDPTKMIRMIILEMEETLVEVRASAARTIADQKELRRHIEKLDRLEADWTEKAQLALSKDREDLAKAALLEKRKATDMAIQLRAEVDVLSDALKASEMDIQKLQKKLADARSRQNGLMTRLESAENRVKLRTMYNGDKVREAFSRFDILERRVDMTEGHADSLAIGSDAPRTLGEEIAMLADTDHVDEELEAMKKALNKSASKEG
jgi:phage shock protein A